MRKLEQIMADLDKLVHVRNPLVLELAQWHFANPEPDACKENQEWIKAHPEITVLACLLVACTISKERQLMMHLTGETSHALTHVAVELAQRENHTVSSLVAALRDNCTADMDDPKWDARYRPEPLINAGYLTYFDFEKCIPVPAAVGEKAENLNMAWEIAGVAVSLEEAEAELEQDKPPARPIQGVHNPDLPLQ